MEIIKSIMNFKKWISYKRNDSVFEKQREEMLEVLNYACYQYKELNSNLRYKILEGHIGYIKEGFRYKTLERYTEVWYEFLENLSSAFYYFDLFSTLLVINHPLFKKEREKKISCRNFIIFNNNIVSLQFRDNFYREIPGRVNKLKALVNNNHFILYRLGYKIVFTSKYSNFLKELLYLFYLYLLLSFVFIYDPSSKKGVFVDFSADRDFFDKFYEDINKKGILGVRIGDLQYNYNNISNKKTQEELEEKWEKFVINIKPFYLYRFLQKNSRELESFEEKNIPLIYNGIVMLFKNKRYDPSLYLELFLYPFMLKLKKFWDFYKEIKLLYEYGREIQIESLKRIYTYTTNTLNFLKKFYKEGYFKYIRLFNEEVSLIDHFYNLFEKKIDRYETLTKSEDEDGEFKKRE